MSQFTKKKPAAAKAAKKQNEAIAKQNEKAAKKKPASKKKGKAAEDDPIQEVYDDPDLFADLEQGTLELLGEVADPHVNFWCPTGCQLLDLAINQGLPGGRTTEIFGDEATGKTALALSVVKQAQLRGGIGIWLDCEAGFSVTLADNIVKVVRKRPHWIYNRPNNAEESLDALEFYCERARNSPVPVVVVVDSVAGMCPEKQQEHAIGETHPMGNLARLLSLFFNRPGPRTLMGSNVFLIFLNQVRSTLATGYGDPAEMTPGGKALKFYASVRIRLTKGDVLKEKTSGNTYGQMVEARIVKNKHGPPLRGARYPFYYREDQPVRGICDAMASVVYLTARKVFPVASKGWYYVGDKKMSILQIRRRILEDGEFADAVREMVRDTFLGEHGHGRVMVEDEED